MEKHLLQRVRKRKGIRTSVHFLPTEKNKRLKQANKYKKIIIKSNVKGTVKSAHN